MKILTLPCGRATLLDDDDFARLGHLPWYSKPPSRNHYTFYVFASVDGRTIYLHREILGIEGDLEVDHKNGDGLDNRRANLRVATHSQNAANTRRANRTGLRGVSAVQHGRYKATICFNNKTAHIGVFDSAEGAALAYDRAALARFGEFARLNFPAQAEAA